MEAKRIRIAVAMMPDGEWNSAGWGDANKNYDPSDKAKIACARDALPDGETIYWVEADIPIPEQAVIEGEVS